MMARTHIAFGVLAALFFLPLYPPATKALFMPAVVLGSLLPDLDHPKSKLGRKLKPIAYLFSFLFGHRGLFHAIWIPAALLLTYYHLYNSIILFGLAVGYLSHLSSDALTLQGVNLIHPFQKLSIAGFIETGKALESILFFAIVIMIVVKLA